MAKLPHISFLLNVVTNNQYYNILSHYHLSHCNMDRFIDPINLLIFLAHNPNISLFDIN